MKFVIDANILFALSNPKSAASSLFSKFSLKLFSPNFSLVEIEKYKDELSIKSKIDFNSAIKLLNERVIFIDNSEYSGLIRELSSKISDPKDVPYLAVAHKLKLPIWSNDKHLKEQSLIPVFTTKELIELLSS